MPPLASDLPSPSTPGSQGAIPARVADYLLRCPLHHGKIDIRSHELPVQFAHYRGVKSLVLAEGWSDLERWGVWSDQDHAVLYLRNPYSGGTEGTNDNGAARIVIDSLAGISEHHLKVLVRFMLGISTTDVVFEWPNITEAKVEIPIPSTFGREPILCVTLEIQSPKSPYESTRGVSPDRRRLGIGLRSIEIHQAEGRDKLLEASNEPPDGQSRAAISSHGLRGRSQVHVVAITMAYNEGNMLRRWLAHYGRHLGESNLIIVDHGSDDGSTVNLGAAGRVPLPRTPFDDAQRADLISGLQHALLRYYDAVIYTDCDEFLVPDPRRFPSLRDYVVKMSADCIRPVGFNLIHIRDREAPLRPDQAFLDQRSYCRFHAPECKPAITRVPVRWEVGFHSCNRKALLDPDILLLHAKLADYDAALARLATTRSMPWSEHALPTWGVHQRAGDETLIGIFEAQERALRGEGSAPTFCPHSLAERVNAQMETSTNPLVCSQLVEPLCRVPAWLRGAV